MLGLRAFRESSYVEHCGAGPAGPLRVTLKAEESHEVKVQQLKAWLKSVGKSPREQALKTRLQELLGCNAPDGPKENTSRAKR